MGRILELDATGQLGNALEFVALATGRVWSGGQALELGLVDEIGGPLEALADARRRAGLEEEDRYLLELHPRISPVPSWLRAPGRQAKAAIE